MNKTTEIYSGRPSDSARDPVEMNCYDLLDSLGIDYMRADHEHADTIEICHPIEKELGCKIAKNLFLANRQQTDFYLLIMPGDKPFKTKILSKLIGTSRLSFGTEENMEKLLKLHPGSVSILGLMNDKEKKIHLLIDNDIAGEEYIGFHPCKNTSTLKLKYDDIISKILPAIEHEPVFVDLPWDPDNYITEQA